MLEDNLDLSRFKLNYEASGEFSFLLLDIFRNITKDLDLMSIVSGKKLYHYIGENVLEKTLNKAIELCSDDSKFNKFVKSLNEFEKNIIYLLKKFESDKSLDSFKELYNTFKQLTESFVLIDFDATSDDENKIKENLNIYSNYRKIGPIKNNLRKFINEVFLIRGSYFNKSLTILAEKFEIKPENIFLYKEDELDILLNEGLKVSEKEIDKRKDSFIIVGFSNKIYYFFGDNAKKETERIRKEQSSGYGNPLKGNTSYQSKEKIKGEVFIFKLNFCNIREQVKNFTDKLENHKGNAILVADVTTPEMTPIFNKLAAIVTTYGGINTHAAIISRELKIPCVVGVKGATDILKDGDLIEVDTENGLVKLIK